MKISLLNIIDSTGTGLQSASWLMATTRIRWTCGVLVVSSLKYLGKYLIKFWNILPLNIRATEFLDILKIVLIMKPK